MSSTHSNQDNVDATLPDPPGAAASSAPAPAPERKPFRIGPYAVLGQIGRGAMGMVYAAYDEKLDRKVALKLLHSLQDTGTLGPARLLREAQSLARVSHPNVVQVFEVGQHDDEVFIAMEFVRGVTLRSWLTPASNGRPRGWREVLGIYLQAGRGLAAAHAAGVVHRDFKPDNVMIGDDGRVRVMDFGLAYGRALPDPEPAPNARISHATAGDARAVAATMISSRPSQGALVRLTGAGATIQGTPAYMAPEQWRGRDAEVTTDQFGWSVMAWEVLFGERPFAGDTVGALAFTVLANQRRPPPRRGVPKWLRKILDRGLAPRPIQRWPSMSDLVAALERGHTRARVRLTGAALIGAGALAGAALGAREWDLARREAACESAGAALATTWNDDVRQQLRAVFLATRADNAANTLARLLPRLDEQVAAWAHARVAACRLSDLERRWSPDTEARAVWCLEDRQMELEALVAEFTAASAATVQKSVWAVANLRPVAPCIDEALLLRQPAPPSDAREALRAVRVELSCARSLALAGNYNEALRAAQAARAADEVRAWPPLWADARAQEAHILARTGDYPAAELAGAEAYFAAARVDAWEVAAGAATDLIVLVGHRLARHADARMWARHAELAADHVGDPLHLWQATRLDNLAMVDESAGAYADARALHEQALALLEQALGDDHPDLADSLGHLANVHFYTGAYADARALYERALAIEERTLGPGHPAVATSLNNLANIHHATGAYADALALHTRALAIRERTLGPGHPDVAASLGNLAAAHRATGDYTEARALNERALAIYERTLGPNHPGLAASLNNLAVLAYYQLDYDGAVALHERALAIHEQTLGKNHPDVAAGLHNLAQVQYARHEYAAAIDLNHRALAIWERALGPDHPDVASSLGNIGNLYLALRRAPEALAPLERAVKLFAVHPGTQSGEEAASFDLARALVLTGGDRARAAALAAAALAAYRARGDDYHAEVAEVSAWLAAHPP